MLYKFGAHAKLAIRGRPNKIYRLICYPRYCIMRNTYIRGCRTQAATPVYRTDPEIRTDARSPPAGSRPMRLLSIRAGRPEALSASAAFPPESPNPFDRIIICLFCPQSRRYRSPRRRSDRRCCLRFLRLRSGQSLTRPERRPAADRAFRTAYRRTAQALRYLP